VTPTVVIGRCPEAEVPHLFGLAKSVFADARGWSDARVLEALARDLLFLAEEDGEPAGYVALRHEPDGAIVVEQLLVVPGHERRGMGHRLLAYVEGYAIAERAPALRIVVEQDNAPARDFYRRAGFVPVDTEVVERSLPTS
jgi:ribosomal protein S18 acetylase RimI-like enzyme